ncbi:uncharacterized protein LOC107789466 isoform X1 [Nicotiana tabacum]|uniref:Uncharacterized protein LOC107789466 isoform X1 n=1 Tax=Nicotiana tabacum TaxID=4097 RepID=A0AC58U9H3_TOBAC
MDIRLGVTANKICNTFCSVWVFFSSFLVHGFLLCSFWCLCLLGETKLLTFLLRSVQLTHLQKKFSTVRTCNVVKMYLEPRYNQCTRGRRHTLTPLRFGFGSHQCAPEFKEIKLLKARLKRLAYLFWVHWLCTWYRGQRRKG